MEKNKQIGDIIVINYLEIWCNKMKYLSVLLVAFCTVLLLVFGQNEFMQDLNNTTKSAKAVPRMESVTSWANKNWYAIGDSITYANKYQQLVKNRLGMNWVKTDAVPGRPVLRMADNITADSLRNIDLITVFGGTNDYGSNKPLGTIHDSQNKDTFYGNLEYLVEKISENKEKSATVVFMTPLIRGQFKNQPIYPNPNFAGYTLEDYVKAEKQVCKKYSIPVIDLFHKSGISRKNLELFTLDNLHPNDAGHEMIAKVIIKELKHLKLQ